MVQESIKHFPIPLRKSLKAIAEGDFLDFSTINKLCNSFLFSHGNFSIKPILQLTAFAQDFALLCSTLLFLVESAEKFLKIISALSLGYFQIGRMATGRMDRLFHRKLTNQAYAILRYQGRIIGANVITKTLKTNNVIVRFPIKNLLAY